MGVAEGSSLSMVVCVDKSVVCLSVCPYLPVSGVPKVGFQQPGGKNPWGCGEASSKKRQWPLLTCL